MAKKFLDYKVRVSSPLGMQMIDTVDRGIALAKCHIKELREMADTYPRYWNAVVTESKYDNTWILYAESVDSDIKVIGPFKIEIYGRV